jgi:hypothetical protein
MCGIEQVPNRPNSISNAKRHRWRAAQAFMDAAQIVMSDIQRHSGAMRL